MSDESSRELSPDWLRSSDPTTKATSILFTVSSSDDDDDLLPIRSVINTKPLVTADDDDIDDVISLPSDSDHGHYSSDKQQADDDADDDDDVSDSRKGTVKLEHSPNKRRKSQDTTNKEIDDHPNPLPNENKPQTGPYISSSTLPLLLPDKIQRTKALVECEGESIDLSGDLGVVGRVVISDSPSGNQDMFLDLKGTIYKTTIIPSRTFCVVSFGQSEAKVEAIMNDFIQLKPQSNVYEAETMVEGTLEGFSFESEDEADKQQTIRQADETEGAEPQTNGKGRRKADKTSETSKKKGKAAVKKPAKKVKRKAPAAKKTKAKK